MKIQKSDISLNKIVSLSKRRGFVYGGSEIYGGLSNTFDYGPYGIELLNNLKSLWWKHFVHLREDIVGLDSSVFLNSKVWKASGHIDCFNDPLIDCKSCKIRIRVDKFLEEKLKQDMGKKTEEELSNIFKEMDFACPNCGKKKNFTELRKFNLMFKTSQGAIQEDATDIYLRPETAQGIFINFKNIIDSTRVKIPFGIAQIGKSFRNEIVARQFIFRTREFEQMEMEFFVQPNTQREWFQFWLDFCLKWLQEKVQLRQENIRIKEHSNQELSFYSEQTSDIQYKFPFGWDELWGIASRTDYDLKQHSELSSEDLNYQDKTTHKKYIPYVIEPALGLNRLFLAVLTDAYEEEELENSEKRTVLHLSPNLSPIKIAIFPLMKKNELVELAKKIYEVLKEIWYCEYDDGGAIGKRYRRQDEIGTPFCVTIDYDSLKDENVTIRERDSMNQKRVNIQKLKSFFIENIG